MEYIWTKHKQPSLQQQLNWKFFTSSSILRMKTWSAVSADLRFVLTLWGPTSSVVTDDCIPDAVEVFAGTETPNPYKNVIIWHTTSMKP